MLASISSLIFQLPLMLALFEIRAGIRARAASAANADMELEWDGGVGNGNGAASASATNGTNGATALSLPGDQGVAPTATDTDAPKTPWEHEGYKAAPGSGSGGGHRHERRQSPLHLTAYILRRVVTTPPMVCGAQFPGCRGRLLGFRPPTHNHNFHPTDWHPAGHSVVGGDNHARARVRRGVRHD